MNQLLDQKTQAPPTRFTAKQGQHLAFIWAYSQIIRRAPAEADFQRYLDQPFIITETGHWCPSGKAKVPICSGYEPRPADP